MFAPGHYTYRTGNNVVTETYEDNMRITHEDHMTLMRLLIVPRVSVRPSVDDNSWLELVVTNNGP